MNKNQLLKRFIQILIVLIGISFMSFLLIYLAPGDPVRAMFAVSGSIPSEETMEEMREEMGLNKPFIVQYEQWISSCIKGDFGASYSQGRPVSDMLMERVGATLNLALLSLGIMIILAVPIGVISAIRQNTIVDYICRGITFVSISMPNFWVGLLLLYFLGVKLRVLPVVSTTMDFKRMLLPAFTLGFAMAGKYARQVRAAILEEMNKDYVSGALARGISRTRVLTSYIIPNAMLPLLTMLGLSLGSLLGGTAVVEVIFSYPALGSLAISAITAMDYPLIQGYILWIALIYMVVNLGVDISYGYLDPRLKKGV